MSRFLGGGAAGAVLALALATPAAAQGGCTVFAYAPSKVHSWPERRAEMLRGQNFHRFAGSAAWRFGPEGIELCAGRIHDSREVRYRISLIDPVWRQYGAHITAAAARHGVPAELILTAIIEESGGKAHAVVHYPGFVSDAATPHKVSIGLGQLLLSSAQRLTPERRISRAWLLEPANAIDVIARYFAHFYPSTGFDPPLAASAYNTGSVRPSAGNRWSVANPRYVESFVAVFNASMAHLAVQPNRPQVSFAALFAEQPAPSAAAPAAGPVSPQPKQQRFGR